MDTQRDDTPRSENRSPTEVNHVLSNADIDLLRALATAPSLTAAAASVGLSVRHTRRVTSQMLARMGVTNVRTAIAVAAARGLIDEPPSALHVQHAGRHAESS